MVMQVKCQFSHLVCLLCRSETGTFSLLVKVCPIAAHCFYVTDAMDSDLNNLSLGLEIIGLSKNAC